MTKMHDLTGRKYGRLVVTKVSHKTHSGTYWFCKCDCGNTIKAIINHLNNGHIKSCGCLKKENAKKSFTIHGLYKIPEYRAWIGMKSRCYNHKTKGFKNYGGRGIKVCNRWLNSFENFYSDVGKKLFSKASIDRIDNDKNYSPNNCRWTDRVTQNNNKRNSFLTIDNVTKKLKDWFYEYNIKPITYHNRINRGWSKKEAMITPVRKHN